MLYYVHRNPTFCTLASVAPHSQLRGDYISYTYYVEVYYYNYVYAWWEQNAVSKGEYV